MINILSGHIIELLGRIVKFFQESTQPDWNKRKVAEAELQKIAGQEQSYSKATSFRTQSFRQGRLQ
jgi:hypothetical protein